MALQMHWERLQCSVAAAERQRARRLIDLLLVINREHGDEQTANQHLDHLRERAQTRWPTDPA